MATEVVLPNLGITVESGKIDEWKKSEGDSVEKGEVIFVVETDKVTTEVESPASGILARILVQEGVEVPVLTVVAVITEPGEALPEKYLSAAKGVPGEENKRMDQSEERVERSARDSDSARIQGPVGAVPAARKLARDRGIDLRSVKGTGPGGVILLKDVRSRFESEGRKPSKTTPLARKVAADKGVPLKDIKGTGVGGRIFRADLERATGEKKQTGEHTIIPMKKIRKVIARRMSESAFTAPHIYFFTDVRMDPLLDFRNDMLPDFEETYQLRPSINDFLIKAVALNLRDFSLLNSLIKDEEIHILPDINIGIAVALPDGLMVPAIANADEADLSHICRDRRDMAQKARNGKLTMMEIERGTFTISSLAQYDIKCFTAIINPPQSGILSVGKTREELAMVDGSVRAQKICTMGLSVDHRIIDGALAADFLQKLKWKLEKPWSMFVTF